MIYTLGEYQQCCLISHWAAQIIVSHLLFLHNVEFGDNEHADSLVKARTHTQALLVRTPVQAGNWLSGQSDVLQEVDRASHAHIHAIRVLLASLCRILTGNITTNISRSKD